MDFFNRKRVALLEEENHQLQQALQQQNQRVDELQAQIDAAKRDDSVPWVEIFSDGYDDAKGVKIAMDWNDRFITYLEELNIKGPTAEAAVQRWLAMVNLYLIEQLEQEAIDTDPRGTVRDVVDGY